jgi:hypothetical protein
MTTDDDGPVAATRHLHDYGLLRESGMREHLCSDTILSRLLHNIRNLSEQPFSSLSARLRLAEARVVCRILLDILLDVIPSELRNKTPDILCVLELLGIRRLLLDCANLGIEVCDVEEVASATAALFRSAMTSELDGLHTAESSYRSSSVICRVTPGATSMVREARGLTLSGFASTVVAQAAARMVVSFMVAVQRSARTC